MSGCGQTRILLAAAAVGATRKVQQRARSVRHRPARICFPPMSSRVHFSFSVLCWSCVAAFWPGAFCVLMCARSQVIFALDAHILRNSRRGWVSWRNLVFLDASLVEGCPAQAMPSRKENWET